MSWWQEQGPPRELDLVGIGQSSIDHVGLLDGLPAFAGKEPLVAYECQPGGQISTAVLAASRLGLRAAFVGTVGDDEASLAVLAPLRAADIDVEGVRVRVGTPTQVALILVDRESGERTVVWFRDPRLRLSPGDLRREQIERGRALLLDAGDPEAATWAAKVAREARIPVILDADTPMPGIDALLATVDFPIVSREFAEQHFGSVRGALAGLEAAGARLPVVTLGKRGALASSDGKEIRSPGFAVAAHDTTGAGDAFHAAFVWGLLEGFSPEEILRAANAAAALNCRALGAQGGLATREQLLTFLAQERPREWREPEAVDRRSV
ncbi:MAG: carbohydrate kinase family protein [Myxococcota bacterium]